MAQKLMTNRQFKGVVFDVDGTLITSSYTVSERMRDTCRKLVQQGIWLTIASARPPKSVRKIGAMIGSSGPFCALNGSTVVQTDGEISWRLSIPDDAARSVINQFAKDGRVNLSGYAGDRWFINRVDEQIKIEAAVVELEPEMVEDLSSVGPFEKILLMTDGALAESLTASISKENPSVIVSRSGIGYIEITAAGADKARGVVESARLVGISPQDLVACGDGENDITMLRSAGHGIAMGHAHKGLHSVASQIVGSNNDDSLAKALETLFGL